MAHLLTEQGVGPGQCVALLFERSAEAIVAMLAVLKTGAAYLPIDPAHPDARIEFMLADAAPIAAITTAGLRSRLDGCGLAVIDIDDPAVASQPGTALPAPAADDVAYLIYTSGTTGVPKGVAITHANLTSHLAQSTPTHLPAEQVWTQCHSYGFDFSVWEIWAALLGGARLVVVPEEVAGSPEDFHALLVARTGHRAYPDPVGGGGAVTARGWSRWPSCSAVRPARPRWSTSGRPDEWSSTRTARPRPRCTPR